MARKKTSKPTETAAEELVDKQAKSSNSDTSEEIVSEVEELDEDKDAKAVEETANVDEKAETEEPAENDNERVEKDQEVADETGKSEPETQSSEQPSEPQKGESSFLPLALGGIAAGAIGFAAAFFGLAQKPDPELAAVSEQIQQIEATVGQQSSAIAGIAEDVQVLSVPDMSAIEGRLDEVRASVSTLLARLDNADTLLDAIDKRLTTLEKRPVTEGASQEAVDAYERELKAAAADFARQREELEALIASALETEDEAEEASKAAMRRAGVSRILSALESGAPFEGALADLREAGVEIPEALSAIADTGVTTATDLQEAFPDAARSALAVARTSDSAAEGSGGFSAFLRNQLGARSLEPREGDDPDAVLSRAEAATREGRVSDALSEIDTLPEEAKAEFSSWIDQATDRLNALRAAQELSETLK